MTRRKTSLSRLPVCDSTMRYEGFEANSWQSLRENTVHRPLFLAADQARHPSQRKVS